jgi:hypothetical protein
MDDLNIIYLTGVFVHNLRLNKDVIDFITSKVIFIVDLKKVSLASYRKKL